MSEKVGVAGFIDLETTGLDPYEDEIIEISIAIFRFDWETGEILEIIDEYTGMREPSVPIKKAASEVHGIYRRHVKAKSIDEDRLKGVLQKCGGILIAHNAEFDKGFFDNIAKTDPPIAWYCSMKGIDWKKHGYRSKSLHFLLSAHGIEIEKAHRAGHDVRAAIALLQKKNKQGEYYLKELLSGEPINEWELRIYKERKEQEKQVAATVEQAPVEIREEEGQSTAPKPQEAVDEPAETQITPSSMDQNESASVERTHIPVANQPTGTTDEQPDQSKSEKPKRRILSTILLVIAAIACMVWLGGFGLFVAGMIASYLVFRTKRK